MFAANKRSVVSLSCLLLLSGAIGRNGRADAQSPTGMPPEAVSEAISYGIEHVPQAYALHQAPSRGEQTNPAINARVYTPFIRVALAARRAFEEGRSISASTLPSELAEPLVYVAIRRSVNPVTGHEVAVNEVRLVLTDAEDINGQHGLKPVWTSSPDAVLNRFEQREQIDDFLLVAAFPASAIQPGFQFVIDKGNRVFSNSPITKASFDHWR